jgi:thiol-disulfide isomerase/thioredoxin
MNEILFRAATSALILAVATAAWVFIRKLTLRRAKNAAVELEGYRRGGAALVYFSSPFCAPCRAVQRPAVERFRNAVGSAVQVIEVDTSERPELAERWGVFSLPTTILIDSMGHARTVNPGVASAETLLEQARILKFPVPSAP